MSGSAWKQGPRSDQHTPLVYHPFERGPRDLGWPYLWGDLFVASRPLGVAPTPARWSRGERPLPGLAVLAVVSAGEDKMAPVASVAVLRGHGLQGQDVHVVEVVPFPDSCHTRRVGPVEAVTARAVALGGGVSGQHSPLACPRLTQHPAGDSMWRPCRDPDTHQPETHSVLAIRAAQPLQADSAVQLEGRLGAGVLDDGGVPASAEVELVEGVDILMGKLIKCL